MTVRYLDRVFEIEGRMVARKLLEQLDLLPETVVVTRNGEIVTEDEMLEVDDDVELIRVISGGS